MAEIVQAAIDIRDAGIKRNMKKRIKELIEEIPRFELQLEHMKGELILITHQLKVLDGTYEREFE